MQAGLISHQSLSNLQNYNHSNNDPPSIQNNYDNNTQNSWVQYDQQYNQPDSKVWQPELVTHSEYRQEESQQGFQQNGKI